MRSDPTRTMPGAFHMDYTCPPVILGSGGGSKPHESSRVSVHSTFHDNNSHTSKNGKYVSPFSSTPSVPGAFSVPSSAFPSDPSVIQQQKSTKFMAPVTSRVPPSSRSRNFTPQVHQQQLPKPQVQPPRTSSSALKNQQRRSVVPKKRRVRIQEGHNEWFDSNLQWEDAINIWYQKADYADFHARMVTAVMTVAQSNDDSARTVLHRLLKASLKAKSENEELFLSYEETRRFQNLYRTYPDLVGLERNVCYPMSKDRSQRKESLVEIVEDMQSFGWPSPEVEAQKVAEASIKASLPSRLVARCLALGVTAPLEEPPRQEQQRKSSTLMQQHSAAHSQDQMVEISPGLAVRLRGAAETRACIEQDFFMPVKCLSCSLDIFCIQDASYVLCPLCRVVSPLEDAHENSYGEGLGLGFTMESLEAIQKEMIKSSQQRRGSH